MASSASGAPDWKKTSEPRVDFDRRAGKWRLRMKYTASSKKPTIIVRSSYVSTREEVEAMATWWRLGWEQGNKGKKVNPLTQVNPPTPPDQQQSSDSPPTAEAMATRTTLPQGKSRNSLHRLSGAQENEFKRQRLAGGIVARGEWMASTVLSDRDKRIISRAWFRRDESLGKKFTARRFYLGHRITELKARVQADAVLIFRLRKGLLGDITELLHADDECSAGERDGMDAEAGGHLAGADALPPGASATQRNRLFSQAMSVMEVVQQQRDRDLLQLGELEDAKRVADTTKATASLATQKTVEAKVFKHMDEASRIRLRFSLLEIAAGVASMTGLKYKPRTILAWVREFRKLDGYLKRDGRGLHERGWIMSEEDLVLKLLKWLKSLKRVSVKKVREYINNVLLAREGGNLMLEKYGLTLPISTSTTHSWLIKLGCKYDRAHQSFYTDAHERKDVVENRGCYVREKRRLALRQSCWKKVEWDSLAPVEQAAFERLMEDGDEAFFAEVYKFESGGTEYVEFHVDFMGGKSNEKYDALREELGEEGGWRSVRFDSAAGTPCAYSHEPAVCKCDKPMYHTGQDESIYKAFAREGNEWVIRGVRGLRKKTEGPGEMVSAFQDERLGFGIPLSAADLVTVNELRRLEKRPDLKESPGTRFLVHGKNKEGYWGYAQFEEQVVDVMDVLEALYPGYQLMIEVDHSAGHAKYREDGLHVGNMNVRFGGKQRALRDTIMVEGCLGPGEAKMYLNRGAWSTQFIEGVTTTTVDLKPRSGETQTMSFPPNAPPPFYACDAPRSDVMGRKARDKRTKRPPQEAGGGGNVGTGLEMGVIREGYAGKAKGRKQVLWERGWFLEGMSTTATVAPEMNIDTVLGNLPDFKNERPALQHLVESRGHILLLSPKFHPELAGVGIEYSCGMSKQKFRREINDEVPKHLHRNMVASMCTDTILTVQRVRRFARRTRDYCRACLALEKGGDIESKDMIEKMKKKCKAHRNILDMEPGFIDKQ